MDMEVKEGHREEENHLKLCPQLVLYRKSHLSFDDHLEASDAIVSSFSWNVECVLSLEISDLHHILQDAFTGLVSDWQVGGPVNHLTFVIIEGTNL